MKIWLPYITTRTGAEVYVRRLAAGLEQRGHDVHLDLAPHAYQYFPWLAPFKEPEGCDVVLANSWNSTAIRAKAPIVTVYHHVVHSPSLSKDKTFAQKLFHRAFVWPMESSALRQSARNVAVSKSTALDIEGCFGISGVDVVFNGIDTQYFTPPATRSARSVNDPLNLLFVGKPSRRKGFEIVDRIVSTLGDRCSFTCIGSGGEAGLAYPDGDYRGRVSKEELRSAYQDADFLLMPSKLEGFGYSAAEALSCGTPVVGAKGGAVNEVCAQKAFLAIEGSEDIRRICSRMLEAAGSGELENMRKAARERAVEALSESRWLDEMERIFETTVARSATSLSG